MAVWMDTNAMSWDVHGDSGSAMAKGQILCIYLLDTKGIVQRTLYAFKCVDRNLSDHFNIFFFVYTTHVDFV